MSSCVGPSPPVTSTTSAREAPTASTATMRSWLSPTTWWCSTSTPIVASALGHPPRVGVRDLPEQELGADADDLGPHAEDVVADAVDAERFLPGLPGRARHAEIRPFTVMTDTAVIETLSASSDDAMNVRVSPAAIV